MPVRRRQRCFLRNGPPLPEHAAASVWVRLLHLGADACIFSPALDSSPVASVRAVCTALAVQLLAQDAARCPTPVLRKEGLVGVDPTTTTTTATTTITCLPLPPCHSTPCWPAIGRKPPKYVNIHTYIYICVCIYCINMHIVIIALNQLLLINIHIHIQIYNII